MPQNWLNALSYLDLAATIALILNLTRNGLFRVYRYFFAYLTADALETLTGLSFEGHRNAYARIYFAGQGLKMLLAVFVVLEIYRIVLEGRPALARFGRETVCYVLIAAAAVAVCGLVLDDSVPAGRSPILHRFNSFERTMDAWMLLFLLMIALFMTWFPVHLTRNGFLYISGFVIYFLVRSLGLLLSNIAPALVSLMDTFMISIAVLCLLTWTFALRKKGEEITVVTGHRWDPLAMDRLTGQLDAINTRLIRFSRR